MQRGRLKGKASRNNKIVYGNFAIQALEPAWISSKQIEATRKTVAKYTKKTGKIWIKIFADKPITARSKESRMGSGKGSVEYWVAVVRPGNIIFELSGASKDVALRALNIARYKLPIKTKILLKDC